FKNGSWNKNWMAPPANTPQANAYSGCSSCGASQIAKPIIATFKKTGVKAATAKRPRVLRIAPANAVKVINHQQGNVIRNQSAASTNFCPCGPSSSQSKNHPVPNNAATTGEATTPTKVTRVTKVPQVPATRAMSSRCSSSVLPC